MPTSKPVFPADRHALYDAHGHSAAIRSGSLSFVSGQVRSCKDGLPEPAVGVTSLAGFKLREQGHRALPGLDPVALAMPWDRNTAIIHQEELHAA